MRDDRSDKQNITHLISEEFDMQPNITYCKRLGEASFGRIRPLLVALSSAEEAAWIVSNAKWLRRSHDHNVSQNVFINANRTKEESRVAYEQRCRRRTTVNRGPGQPRTAAATAAAESDVGSPAHSSHIVVNSGQAEARQSSNTDNRAQQRSGSPGTRFPIWFGEQSAVSAADAYSPSSHSASTIPTGGQSTGNAPTATTTPSSKKCVLKGRQDAPELVDTVPAFTSQSTSANCQLFSVNVSPSARSSSFNLAAVEFVMPFTVAVSDDVGGSCASRGDRL